jgi:hypothetical protein
MVRLLFPLILSFDNVVNVLAAVPRATWTAFYDLRVDMSTKEDPINLIYKAAITQNTGEVGDLSFSTFGLFMIFKVVGRRTADARNLDPNLRTRYSPIVPVEPGRRSIRWTQEE